MDKLLYGKDDEERIVGLHEFGENEVMIYTRTEDDELVKRREEFRPFMHVTDRASDVLLEGYTGIEVRKLSGKGVYDHLVRFETFRQMWSARSHLRSKLGDGEFHLITSIQQQYLTWTGKTLFGGMTMDEIRRMQIDIEVYGSQGFPNSTRAEDEIIIISVSNNSGLELVLHTHETEDTDAGYRCMDERHLLVELVKVIHRHDPDVIEMHNGFGFDLPYLRDRAERLDVNFALGRDNSKPSTYKAKKKFAEREQEYENFQIAGRGVIDSMFQAADFDVYYRGLPNLKLKDLAKHFGFAAENRTYIEGDKISWHWDHDAKPLLDYALDDVTETRSLVEELGNASFELTKILPFSYQETLTAGTSGSIEALMTREYVRQGEAIPEPDAGSPFGGGYTDVFERGVYYDLAYADVSSLYPSIMLNYDVKPEADTLDIFQPLLQSLTDMRLETKREMRAMDDDNPMKGVKNAQQQAYKILINSFYGALGFRFFPWCDFAEAARVTREGRNLLKRLVAVIEEEGGHVILCDTDGVLFELPGEMTDEEVDHLICDVISPKMPEGIEIDNDGRFDLVMAYKKKNYALREKGKDKLKLKGNTLTGRAIEEGFRTYIREQAEALVEKRFAAARRIHETAKEMIIERDLTIDQIKKRGRLKKTLSGYKAGVEDGKPRLAQYELALEKWDRTGVKPLAGDILYYYIAGDKKNYKIRNWRDAKLVEDYDGDENINYYLNRLDSVADIFRPMVNRPEYVYNMDVGDQGELFHKVYPTDVKLNNQTIKDTPSGFRYYQPKVKS